MGNAFDENVYQECMELALKERQIEFEPQKGCKEIFMRMYNKAR